MADQTPPLNEFLARYRQDDNAWWALSGCGHHQNLFDAAIDRAERAEAERDALACRVAAALAVVWPAGEIDGADSLAARAWRALVADQPKPRTDPDRRAALLAASRRGERVVRAAADYDRALVADQPATSEQPRMMTGIWPKQVGADTVALEDVVADQPATSETDQPCPTCGGTGIVPHTGRGPDGYDPCPDCHPSWPDETRPEPGDQP